MSIEQKLENKLKELEYNKKMESGNLLQPNDIRYIFNVLQELDKETAPLLELCKESLCVLINSNYFLVDEHIKECLKYYQIIENKKLFDIRHKLFFTEDKKMIKEPFLTKHKIELIKEDFNKHNIFSKLMVD